MDNETDTFIQSMIREDFKNCTVLTIAHRLNTIIDSSKILTMDAGVAAEFDTPENLVKKDDGIFAGLWRQHGESH